MSQRLLSISLYKARLEGGISAPQDYSRQFGIAGHYQECISPVNILKITMPEVEVLENFNITPLLPPSIFYQDTSELKTTELVCNSASLVCSA